MKNIQSDLQGYNYQPDKILPNLNLRRTVCNELLIMDIKWPNLSLSQQPGWVQEIDGMQTDACVIACVRVLHCVCVCVCALLKLYT